MVNSSRVFQEEDGVEVCREVDDYGYIAVLDKDKESVFLDEKLKSGMN